MTTRAEIAAAAMGYVGTPYHPQGRSRAGVSCVGLLIAVGADLGLVPDGYDPGPYPERPDGTMIARLRQHLDPVAPVRAEIGAVLVIAGMGQAQHVGILTATAPAPRFVHASRPHGRVVLDQLDHNWRLRAARVMTAFDFRGVADVGR